MDSSEKLEVQINLFILRAEKTMFNPLTSKTKKNQ